MTPGFQTPLSVRLKDGDRIWVVVAPLVYCSVLLDARIVVPPWFETKNENAPEEYFETDLASVPRLPVIYTAWGDRAHREAVLHDYLYRSDSAPVVAKSQADRVFLEAMESTGKPFWIRYPMFWGVVFGGGRNYHQRKVRDRL